eukprot:2078587-Lingulodinium_polyedra.AAC.1
MKLNCMDPGQSEWCLPLRRSRGTANGAGHCLDFEGKGGAARKVERGNAAEENPCLVSRWLCCLRMACAGMSAACAWLCCCLVLERSCSHVWVQALGLMAVTRSKGRFTGGWPTDE